MGLIYVLGIAGGAFTVLGTSLLSRRAGALDVTLYSYLTPNVCAMAVAVFVLFRYVLGLSDERSRRQRAGRLAGCGFGVYLSHVIFLVLLRHFGLATPPIPTAVAVPLLTLVIFLPSFLLSWLIHKIPVVGRYLT